MSRTLRHGTSFQKFGALCSGVAHVLARGVALVLAASLATGLVPHRALAAPGDITTLSGGLGQGPALNIGQWPFGVAVRLLLGTGAGWCADAPAKTSGNPPSTANDKVDRFVGQPKTPAAGVCPSLP